MKLVNLASRSWSWSWVWTSVAWSWLLAQGGGGAWAQDSDVFVIRATLSIVATDSYHQELESGSNTRVTERNDGFVVHYEGAQTHRLVDGKWKVSEPSMFRISGGGQQTVTVTSTHPPLPPEVDTRSWTYGIDPSAYSPTKSYLTVTFGSRFKDCAVGPPAKFPIPLSWNIGPALVLGEELPLFAVPLFERIPLPTNTLSYAVDRTYVTNRITSYTGLGESGELTGTYRYQVIIQRNPPDLEAVIVTKFPAPVAAPSYEDWLPIGGKDDKTKGTNLLVRVELREKGAKEPTKLAKAYFHFVLQNVSREPGVCLNVPHRDRPAYEEAADVPPDLRFEQVDGLSVTGEGLTADTVESVNAFGLAIGSYDYGAYASFTATAEVDGRILKAHLEEDTAKEELRVPKDDDGNHIADAWEKEQAGLAPGLPADWDEADQPGGQFQNGDGISLYEKYRGFVFEGIHERLNPKQKYLFVYDASGVVIQTLAPGSGSSFQKASGGITLRLIYHDGWTGPGAYSDKKRIVNFNSSKFGHAVDQHALHVRTPAGQTPTTPDEYQDMYKAKYGHLPDPKDLTTTFGITWPDQTSPGARLASPRDAFLIEEYSSKIDWYTTVTVRYNTWSDGQRDKYQHASPAERAQMDQDFEDDYSGYMDAARANGQLRQRAWAHASAVIVHEMGHGVGIDDLQPPNDQGPTNCVMRYLRCGDFARDPKDRLELARRWTSSLQPTVFCHDPSRTKRGLGCYEQIQVTDRQGGAAPGAMSASTSSRGFRPMAQAPVPVPLSNAFVQVIQADLPAFEVGAELEWAPQLTGDPLRLAVTLRSPRWSQALILAQMQGVSPDPALAPPTVGTNWVDGVRLTLYRIDTNASRQLLLGPDQWRPFLRDPASGSALFDTLLATHRREWMTVPASAALQAGSYVLTVAWDGRGLAEAALLPADGSVTGQEVAFAVQAPATDIQRASHLRRMAFQEWDTHQDDLARQHGLEAMALDPQNQSRDAVETHFVVASANLRQGDILEAAQAIQNLRQQLPTNEQTEIAEQARAYLQALVPELRIVNGPTPGSPVKLEIQGHPGQKYVVQAADKLAAWKDLQTVVAPASRFEVLDPAAGSGQRYYRILWAK
jgi:hypothetical protein